MAQPPPLEKIGPYAYDAAFYVYGMMYLGMVRFGRRVLTSCWEAVLDVLSVLTSGRSCCGISSSLAAAVMFNAREESRRVRQAICTSLAGLQKAARLSNVLGTISRMLRLGLCP